MRKRRRSSCRSPASYIGKPSAPDVVRGRRVPEEQDRMAKTSQVNRNARREYLAKRDKAKRAALKAVVMDRTLPVEDRFNASLRLAQLPRNGAPVRVHLRCAITGRSRG